MKKIILLISFIGILASCSNDDSESEIQEFVAGEVSVGIKSGTDINDLFEFINIFDHQVDNVNSLTFNSNLESDNLQHVLDVLNEKTYTNDGVNWFVTGYLDSETNDITIFPRLFGMENTQYQTDWINSMSELELTEKHNTELNSGIIRFYVPVGKEIEWRNQFANYDIVDWSELNYISEIQPHTN
ncbi:hypothetical protein [Psychroserpens sp. NJDZ02]|uniref:hypothetical protein n=1 Tax=Psychroserpens sp. NJDZ02 TaxID=2570561 RepID=UPI0010A89020|nr:hypothetical protein [Psychroserpens sp. NJDZ02]QCE42145.1 hypothetical protein E9099_12290 [Psychroserpens sp. NJDZ02]